jgi:hypothetical protein
VTHSFSTTFKPTGDYPRCGNESQILRTFLVLAAAGNAGPRLVILSREDGEGPPFFRRRHTGYLV